MRTAALLLLLAACSDPVVDMSLQLPAGTSAFDTSCLASVSIYAKGQTFTQDPTDYKQACIDLPMAAPTFAGVQAVLHGQVSLPIPDSGLSGVSVLGNSLTCATIPPARIATADLIFYASAPYIGDAITLPMTPSLACPTSTVTAMPVDMLKLATTHQCSMSHVTDSANAGVNVGTLSPSPFLPGVLFSGGIAGSALLGGVATIASARTMVAANTCLALYAGDDALDALSCAQTTPAACAAAGQIEIGVLASETAGATLDQTLASQYGPATFGLVYSGTGETGAPVSGATVTLDDETAGAVVYYDVPAAAVGGTGGLTKLTTRTTSASGMFVVYATGFHTLTIAQNGRTMKVRIAAVIDDPGTVIARF